MKILLLGADGQLGTELRRSLAPLGTLVSATCDGTLPGGGRCETLDFLRPESIAPLIDRIGADVVVNAAAYTAVDRAEGEPDLAHAINATAPASIATACAARDALLLHYSTDYVFDGSATRPWREDDATAPLGVYGASKLAGERSIAASGVRHLVLRTAWLYALHGSNFLRTMLRLAGEGRDVRVVADQFGSPTPAWLVADVSATVLADGVKTSGVRHLAAGGRASWHDFAMAIFSQAQQRGLIATTPRVDAIESAAYPTRAVRPRYSVLDSRRLRDEYGLVLPDWQDALRRTFE
ncbi:dTDP-4-dehydrorhamnose reductase [Montanilutibacter psychrotolerans]|uniref:dTDP-4-dehydrorhamnose reductase n=1 Tax=Montanilutibacter psychrotolerans TaxID=1327343 RepID=A0A3M8T4J8_9GAMM|nr:dTDP-4-dehydrorhamnose reductase [Lysobacter psychrotolerans]RNF86130.1 dTDP-4-dehydrorhamnose reductase [Lysobacter psychrotolerans]